MIVKGKIGADEITGAGLSDPRVLDLSRRIRLVDDAAISARFPSERFAVVTLTTRDNRSFQSGLTEAHGGPLNPLSDQEIDAKFNELTGMLGESRRQSLKQAVHAVEAGPSSLADLIASQVVETK
jgi:2-methylcitrate dehydratase PrpD